MSLTTHLHDPVSGFAFEHPVILPCGHTVDVSTAVRITKCTIDREPFQHINLRTNHAIKENLDQLRGKSAGQSTTSKIIFYFHEFKLKFVQKGEVAAPFTRTEWKQAETTFTWLFQHLPKTHQTSLETSFIFKGVLEWSPKESSYTYTVSSENHNDEVETLFRLLISENWAQNFAGKYFGSLKSKNVEKNKQ